jgi:hypothetical protein
VARPERSDGRGGHTQNEVMMVVGIANYDEKPYLGIVLKDLNLI